MTMVFQSGPATKVERKYYGHILHGNYSERLKTHIAECFNRFFAFELAGNPAIPYISAWHAEERRIWYEFISKNLLELFNCEHSDVSEIFRNSIIDHRIYKSGGLNAGVIKEVITGRRLNHVRDELRQETEKSGVIEAVYKIRAPKKKIIWVKDQATVSIFHEDRIYLCSGCLTVVTNEIEAEEERERLIANLKEALTKVKTLSGLIPICASCKKIRDDKGFWKQVEIYISEHSDADFSHGICPDCYEKATRSIRRP